MNELQIAASDGFLIHAFVLEPEGVPRAHIHLIHGMAEHIDRYEEFANYLAGHGYLVSGHDHRGHGKTVDQNGKPGHLADADGFARAVQDSYEVIHSIRVQYPASRFVLFGHSMGSFVARRYIQLHGPEVDLAILSGTGGDPGLGRIAGQLTAYLSGKKSGFDEPNPFVNKLIFGRYNKNIPAAISPFDWLSTDTEAVESYVNDPKCGVVPTTRFFADLFDGLAVINKANEIAKVPKTLPILLFSGDADPVGGYGKGVWETARQYDDAGVRDVTVLLFEGKRHEMLHETNRQQVFELVEEWMGKHEN
ncbi:alpha/beta fold family hydrolase [Bacillus sp. OxB-1]|uniref:alpha/beta hydrolase n=1 Tax=Bacillus sp. (strain OxB-1) TaxID=98228 RepID=UPI00058218D1|nr:alpha/beta hydrolase [Bacillus sp. OxB-1]BAQ10598.1 alpha/beta fold family hydrolase [Bacillus sp. OxB-1]